MCEKGGYIIKMMSHNSKVTLIASGSEVELALKIHENLNDNNIESTVVSMPCIELFDSQSEDYKKKVIDETTLVVTIEAGNTVNWKKFLGNKGMAFGIDRFGESAPYKKIYEHYNLTTDKIVAAIQTKLRNL